MSMSSSDQVTTSFSSASAFGILNEETLCVPFLLLFTGVDEFIERLAEHYEVS